MSACSSEETRGKWSEEHSRDSVDWVHIDLRCDDDITSSSTLDEHQMGGTHTFPTALPDWSNLEVLRRNTLPARASFFIYDNVKDALTRDVLKSKKLSLSGTWKFNLAKSPFDAPPEFFERTFDVTGWGDIEVPGMWQLQGYGKGPQ
jgi:beta-galactosidase